jgi:hypothetical protein
VVSCWNSGPVICNSGVIYRLPMFVSLLWAWRLAVLHSVEKHRSRLLYKTASFLLTFLSIHKKRGRDMKSIILAGMLLESGHLRSLDVNGKIILKILRKQVYCWKEGIFFTPSTDFCNGRWMNII